MVNVSVIHEQIKDSTCSMAQYERVVKLTEHSQFESVTPKVRGEEKDFAAILSRVDSLLYKPTRCAQQQYQA